MALPVPVPNFGTHTANLDCVFQAEATRAYQFYALTKDRYKKCPSYHYLNDIIEKGTGDSSVEDLREMAGGIATRRG